MGTLTRKICNAVPCRPMPFFRPALHYTSADEGFFRSGLIQRQANSDDDKKNPLTEGLKTTGERLLEHKPFKEWYDPKLHQLELTLWDAASPADKAAMLAFLGLNLGTAATAFAVDPKIRAALSDVNIGKPLGWIPYSPVEGFKYTLPKPGTSPYGFSADFTLADYLALLRKKYPHFPLSGAKFGLESAFDPTGKGFSLTGGKAGLEFFGGALKAEGKTFKDLSPYPLLLPGTQPGEPGSWLMQEEPGLPKIHRPGYQFTINADLLKLFPDLRKHF
jgi:hypothetical protein